MLLERISRHVKDQNWFAVVLEFLILVIGVFIGIEVSNWNEKRAETARAHVYLERLEADLAEDADTISFRKEYYARVAQYGKQALAYAEGDKATRAADWSTVLAFFQASQIYPWYRNNSTYDELKSAGEISLLSNSELRSALAEYYVTSAVQTDFILRHVPQYRETVRSLTPSVVTTHIWSNCHQVLASIRQEFLDCAAPVSDETAQQILDRFLADPTLLQQLRSWMSTLTTTQRMLQISGESTNLLRQQIARELRE